MRKLVLVLLIACLVAPLAMATAADKMNFYGRVCVTTMVEDRDKEYTAGRIDSDSGTVWDMTDARLGFDFKVSDAVSAKVEIRSNLVSSNMTRHWYGAWKFSDNGTFVVGRTWAPTFQALTNSNLIDGAADIQGSLREDGLQVWFNIGGGSLKVAALTPVGVTYAGFADSDLTLPKLEVSYNHKFGPVDMNFFGGYNTCDAENVSASGTSSMDTTSYVYGATFAWDPKPFYVKGAVYAGQNLTEYGWAAGFDHALNAAVFYEASAWHQIDTDYLGYILLAGFVVNDRFEVEGGYTHIEMDQSWTQGSVPITREEGADEWYVMATYQLAPNVYMYPEINMLSCADSVYTVNGVDQYAGTPGSAVQGDRTRFGIYWRINF